jgi:hypothetical protein
MAHVDINSHGMNKDRLLYQGFQTLNYSFGRQVKTASQSLGIEFSMTTGKKQTEEHKAMVEIITGYLPDKSHKPYRMSRLV